MGLICTRCLTISRMQVTVKIPIKMKAITRSTRDRTTWHKDSMHKVTTTHRDSIILTLVSILGKEEEIRITTC